MNKRSLCVFIITVVCCCLLVGCTASVRLGTSRFPVDSQTVTAVLSEGDTEKLDELTGLQTADFSGSKCYEEIFTWGQEHPEVELTYTVEFPDGTVVKNTDTSADLSALTTEEAAESAEYLAFLPNLTDVKLGDVTQEQFLLMAQSNPNITFEYEVKVAGKSVPADSKELDLSGVKDSDVAQLVEILPCMGALKTVRLGDETSSSISWESIGKLQQACPEVDFDYGFTLFEKSFSTLDTQMDLNHISMDDEGAAVKAVLPYMKKLTYLDMDFCNVSNESMDEIRQAYPQVDVVWRIWFGLAYSVRTDVIKILASKPSIGGLMTSEDVEVLKYCTKIKYLDLGHNGDSYTEGISDISFVSYMPDLEVFIIAMNGVTDLTPLENCPKLEYLELLSTPVSDLSPLANAKALRHLRLENMPNLTDISPLYGLTELERLWLDWRTPVPEEQIEEMRKCAPNCEIDTQGSNRWTIIGLNEVTWVYTLQPRYALLREQFGYDTLDYSFSWLDPKY